MLHESKLLNTKKINKDVANTLTISYFGKTDTSFLDIPNSNILSFFIEQPFDILINLHYNSPNSLVYIGYLSNASYRIGTFTNDRSNYASDIMINCSEEKNINHLINQIEHYFNFIK